MRACRVPLCGQMICRSEFEEIQELCKIADLLKWLTLPIQASSVALKGFRVTYQE